MTRKHRIGVIGAGARGETFARQLHRGTSRAELFGVCDIDCDRLEKFCDYCELTGVSKFTDPEEFFASAEMDGVIITTPEFTHADVAVLAMTAGKHVYLEKPLAHALEDCYRIIKCQRETGMTAYVGFNLRASPERQKLRDIVRAGVVGQIIHIQGLEQLQVAHGASFMRRFHRKSANSGGLLNHKCSHDLDIMLWTIGHEHRVRRISSFGGTNIYTPQKRPAQYCHQCPVDIYSTCPHKDQAGFVFPVGGKHPIHHRDSHRYGADQCVFNDDKDLVDNQTVIMEWEHGVRGTFMLQMFQARGARETRVWGEHGFIELDGLHDNALRVVMTDGGDCTTHTFGKRIGGHGGTDPLMINRFLDAIEGRGDADSGLEAGLAASLVAVKADEARMTGRVVDIEPEAYCPLPHGMLTHA